MVTEIATTDQEYKVETILPGSLIKYYW